MADRRSHGPTLLINIPDSAVRRDQIGAGARRLAGARGAWVGTCGTPHENPSTTSRCCAASTSAATTSSPRTTCAAVSRIWALRGYAPISRAATSCSAPRWERASSLPLGSKPASPSASSTRHVPWCCHTPSTALSSMPHRPPGVRTPRTGTTHCSRWRRVQRRAPSRRDCRHVRGTRRFGESIRYRHRGRGRRQDLHEGSKSGVEIGPRRLLVVGLIRLPGSLTTAAA